MITIPTYDLVTMIRGVAECAPTTRTDKRRAYVRLACTGDSLVASSYAVSHGALQVWRPEHPVVGGMDEKWEVLLRTAQAKNLAKVFEVNSGAALHIPVTLDRRHDGLRLSRPGDEEAGVDALMQTYRDALDAELPKVEEEFADLVDRPGGDVVIGYAATVALGLASKRTGHPLRSLAFERGVCSTVGGLTVYSRRPSEAEQDEADAQAIVAVAVGDA